MVASQAHLAHGPWTPAAVVRGVEALIPEIRARAPALDREAAFPAEDMDALAGSGVLLAVFPRAAGGLGLGTDPALAAETSALLQALGYAHVALGRLIEAHVNAALLLARYASPALLRRAAEDASRGHAIGLWVTDPGVGGASIGAGGRLAGGKAFCSGAGSVHRAVVTASRPDGSAQMLYLTVDGARAQRLPQGLEGVRCAVTGQVDLSGLAVSSGDLVGQPGDYLREPLFSLGAWRTCAVTVGALAALVDRMIEALTARGRAGAPAQQERIGRAWIAVETARLWLARTAPIAEAAAPAAAALAAVGFARAAIEAASLQALELAERSVGLPAFLEGTELARLRRDLRTYLRQPALDEVLGQAARHVVECER